MNFQGFPARVLEKIIAYCSCGPPTHTLEREKPLIKLMEVNKFLKEFIEANPRLMGRLSLKLIYHSDDQIKNAERITNISLNSTRKYTSAEIHCGGLHVWEKDKIYVEILRKFVLKKHAETIKSVEFYFNSVGSEVLMGISYYLETLDNVEYVGLKFMDHASEYDSYLGEDNANMFVKAERLPFLINSLRPNKYHYLKHLRIEAEYDEAAQKNAEFHRISLENHVNCRKMEILLKVLKQMDLDLTTFHLKFHPIEFNLDLLLNFLESQKNLEELEISGITDKTFTDKLQEIIEGFEKLKKIYLHFD